jgi:hypothetical protein
MHPPFHDLRRPKCTLSLHFHPFPSFPTVSQLAVAEHEVRDTLKHLHEWMQPEEMPTPAWLVPAKWCAQPSPLPPPVPPSFPLSNPRYLLPTLLYP